MAGRSRKKYFMEQEAITLYNMFSGEVTKKRREKKKKEKKRKRKEKKKEGKKEKGQNSPIRFVCFIK